MTSIKIDMHIDDEYGHEDTALILKSLGEPTKKKRTQPYAKPEVVQKIV